MAEWDNIQLINFWLLQVDLDGHSQWMREAPSKLDAASARTELAARLSSTLKLHHFDIAFWAGDGGLYTCRKEQVSADHLCRAIDEILGCFQSWRDDMTAAHQNRHRLNVRVAIHTDEVYAHENSGYWYSDELSLFLKYERDLSHPGTAVITEHVFRHLSSRAQRSWQDARDVSLPDGIQWRVYRYRASVPSPSTSEHRHQHGRGPCEEPGGITAEDRPTRPAAIREPLYLAPQTSPHSVETASRLCSGIDEIVDEKGSVAECLHLVRLFLNAELEATIEGIESLQRHSEFNNSDGVTSDSVVHAGHSVILGYLKKKQRALNAALEELPAEGTEAAATSWKQMIVSAKRTISLLMK